MARCEQSAKTWLGAEGADVKWDPTTGILSGSSGSVHWSQQDLPSDNDDYHTPSAGSPAHGDSPIADLLHVSGKEWASSFRVAVKRVRHLEREISQVKELIGLKPTDSLIEAIMNILVQSDSQSVQFEDLEQNFVDVVDIHEEKFARLGLRIAELSAQLTTSTERASELEKDCQLMASGSSNLEWKLAIKGARVEFLQTCLKEERDKVVRLTALLSEQGKV